MHTSIAVTAILAFARVANAAFGFTATSKGYKVDTDGGLVFEVDKSNGDLISLNYNGVEYQGTGNASGINSGLGTSTVTAETVNGYVKITVKSSGNPVTHYYVAKSKEATVYMATNNQGEVSPGELRFLARLKTSELPTGVHGDVGDGRGCYAFEGDDTFMCDFGSTRSKMYTGDRFIEDKLHCVSGSKAQACMVMPGVAYETSAGGPFMRDINSQTTDNDQELYWYMNSGHVRTEDWRSGLQGPYALTFTAAGTTPSENLDTSFFGSLSIDGYVSESGRGSVTGKTSGVPDNFETVLHWFNKDAQYWTKAQGGDYKSPLMKSGSYTMKMYKGEFLVTTDSVIVTAGKTATKNIASKEITSAAIWRVGEFEGQPFELKNGDKITRVHPSDAQMRAWGTPSVHIVGTTKASEFPAALWSKLLGGQVATVSFQLTSAQVKAHVFRVGTTLSFKGGRPSVKVGSWTGSDPGAPKLIDSRGITRGAYRGYGEVYTWTVPASAFKEGSNTLTLGVSGDGDTNWLSANYIIDAIELQD
ncbi:hypothetical protein CC86DRAFT_303672 [Ophiobolus disseminans]|uniref:rhamnogalacturonan endolyase n=1 Tax=Ophiobolus disseminans TaxID=1469910 RepID=A0A6A6ZLU9_9PLEO|nr:hypothetical protein CC86DRAFT_303672 [Ophiobolus disseminans]